jgi:hypothetical protein
MKLYTLFDSNTYLGALSSTASTWSNAEKNLIEEAFKNNYTTVITCPQQISEYEKNIQNANLAPIAAKYPEVVSDLRQYLTTANQYNITENNNVDFVRAYKKDWFIPALVKEVGVNNCRVVTRDKQLIRKLNEEFPELEVADLNPIKKEIRDQYSDEVQSEH